MRRGGGQSERICVLGRLSPLNRCLVLALAVGVAVVACDQNKTEAVSAPRERSQAVLGKAPNTLDQTAPIPTPEPSPRASVRRALCGGSLSKPGTDVPSDRLERRSASGEPELREMPAFGGGTWTWVNLWAAWCAPCKEEIPRLLSFENRLDKAKIPFRLVFVSLDDDERQMSAFLDSQPLDGLRRTYWLHEGAERTDWLIHWGFKPGLNLPAHALVDPNGKIRCRVDGAVDDSDYDQLLRLLRAPH